MTRGDERHRFAPTVGHRLFLAVLPALLAVALVVGLAYWGEYGRTAPAAVVAAAAVLAVASLAATWWNARHLAARLARLAGDGAGADELDRIESVVDHLGGALVAATADRERAALDAEGRRQEHATVLATTVQETIARLDDVRLPLHILLDSRFGELNENQEELLADARQASDALDAALRRLGQLADAERGALTVQRELVQLNDVVRAVLPLARAAAARRAVRVDEALEPGLPRVMADRVRLAEALALLVEAAAIGVGPERPLVVTTTRERQRVVLTVAPGERHLAGEPVAPGGVVLAARLIEAQGGSIERADHAVTIRLG
ncbi:MAG: hypothetical protein ACXWZS_11800 [Gemmatirosa sp.]